MLWYMSYIDTMNFDEWCYKVCEYQGSLNKKDPHDIYPYIDLTDAKLSFLSGIKPEDYKI